MMKCSRITLSERRQQRSTAPAAPRHQCEPPRYTLSMHNYQTWLYRPCLKISPQRISVSEIQLPDHVQYTPTAGVRRWTDRRPRLRSSRQQPSSNQTVSANKKHQRIAEERPDSEQLHLQQIVQEYAIDEHVQRLIEEANEEPRLLEEVEDGRKSRRRRKRSDGRKKRKQVEEPETRTVRVTVSRPATPDTEQVIRVDVVSNYSVEVVARGGGHCEHTAAPAGEELAETAPNPPPPDLALRCRRLRLTYRS